MAERGTASRVQPGGSRVRVAMILAIMAACALLLVARAVKLQVMDTEFLQSEGEARFLRQVEDTGFAGVQNFPTVGLIDGVFRASLEETGMSYAQEVEKVSKVRVAVIDPGATRTDMRAKAYPGEDPKTVKDPAVVADRLVELLVNDFDGCHRERVEC